MLVVWFSYVIYHITEIIYRVLTVHGSEDETVPVEEAMEFTKVIPNHKLHIVEGANHGYASHQAELVPIVLEFIKADLQQHKNMHYQVPSCPRADTLYVKDSDVF